MNQPNWKVHYGINGRQVCVSLVLPSEGSSLQRWQLSYVGKGRSVRLSLESSVRRESPRVAQASGSTARD